MHEEEDRPSKTALKKQMTALQKVGEQLVDLSERELARIPIDDEDLLRAISDARRIRSNSARKRQLQFIGKLMRHIDPQPIEQALAELHERRRGLAQDFHELEALRDQLVADGPSAVEGIVQRFPHADRQHLRALLRAQQHEEKAGKPPAAARKLFKYLRELSETDPNL